MYPCNLCREPRLSPLLDFGLHPIAHHYLDDPNQDAYVYPVELRYCEGCGLIQLVNLIPPATFYTNYITLSSWKPQPHIPRLIDLIAQMPGIDKTSRIAEVGSNDGGFCKALMNRGYTNVIGIEPAADARAAAQAQGVNTVCGYFTGELAEEMATRHGRCDLLIARQVLEHISDLSIFRTAMQRLLKPGGFVLFEVPHFGFSLDSSDYSAIWEEHANYFTIDTFNRFLAACGIRAYHQETILFSGEALVVAGRYVEPAGLPLESAYLPEALARTLAYRDRWPVFRKALCDYLAESRRGGVRTAVYGAGSRVCSLINFTGIGPYIDFILDDQPEKQNKYLPGSRLPIRPGAALQRDAVDVCLLAVNAENEEKVIARHLAWQQQGGQFFSLFPPSKRLLSVWEEIASDRESKGGRR